MNIDGVSLLLPNGAVLLGVAAFLGFAQARAERGSAAESKWRVVHSGGTAGGVQLLALGAVWGHLAAHSSWASVVAGCIVLSTWLFFVGPLLKALERARSGNVLLWAGAVASVPGYLGLIGLGLTAFGSGAG
jgi:hypothetical protein